MMDHTLDLADIAEMCEPVDMWAYVEAHAGWSPDYIATIQSHILAAFNSDAEYSAHRAHKLEVHFAKMSPYAVSLTRMFDVPHEVLRRGIMTHVCDVIARFYNSNWASGGEHTEWLAQVRDLMIMAGDEYMKWYDDSLTDDERASVTNPHTLSFAEWSHQMRDRR